MQNQKTLLQIVNQVTAELNLPQPQAVVSSQDPNVQKVFALLQAVCDDLIMEYDWNFLQKRFTFSTVNDQESYPFPVDYLRSIDGTFFDETNEWPLKGSLTPTQWEIVQTFTISVSPFERFRLFGGQMHLYPIPTTTIYTFVFDYMSNSYVVDGNTGLNKQVFTQDSDSPIFDARLMIYGVKLKYLAGIGQPVDFAIKDYSRALALAKGYDVPGQRLSLVSGQQRLISSQNFPDGNWNGVS
jgi:hypothetical protein